MLKLNIYCINYEIIISKVIDCLCQNCKCWNAAASTGSCSTGLAPGYKTSCPHFVLLEPANGTGVQCVGYLYSITNGTLIHVSTCN